MNKWAANTTEITYWPRWSEMEKPLRPRCVLGSWGERKYLSSRTGNKFLRAERRGEWLCRYWWAELVVGWVGELLKAFVIIIQYFYATFLFFFVSLSPLYSISKHESVIFQHSAKCGARYQIPNHFERFFSLEFSANLKWTRECLSASLIDCDARSTFERNFQSIPMTISLDFFHLLMRRSDSSVMQEESWL